MLLVAGASSSLFMGAIFLPLFYSGGEERGEMFLVIAYFERNKYACECCKYICRLVSVDGCYLSQKRITEINFCLKAVISREDS